MTKPQFLRRMG